MGNLYASSNTLQRSTLKQTEDYAKKFCEGKDLAIMLCQTNLMTEKILRRLDLAEFPNKAMKCYFSFPRVTKSVNDNEDSVAYLWIPNVEMLHAGMAVYDNEKKVWKPHDQWTMDALSFLGTCITSCKDVKCIVNIGNGASQLSGASNQRGADMRYLIEQLDCILYNTYDYMQVSKENGYKYANIFWLWHFKKTNKTTLGKLLNTLDTREKKYDVTGATKFFRPHVITRDYIIPQKIENKQHIYHPRVFLYENNADNQYLKAFFNQIRKQELDKLCGIPKAALRFRSYFVVERMLYFVEHSNLSSRGECLGERWLHFLAWTKEDKKRIDEYAKSVQGNKKTYNRLVNSEFINNISRKEYEDKPVQWSEDVTKQNEDATYRGVKNILNLVYKGGKTSNKEIKKLVSMLRVVYPPSHKIIGKGTSVVYYILGTVGVILTIVLLKKKNLPSTSKEQIGKSTSKEQIGKSTSAEHTGKSTSKEQIGKSTSAEHTGKSTSKEQIGKSTSAEHTGKSTSNEQIGKSTSTGSIFILLLGSILLLLLLFVFRKELLRVLKRLLGNQPRNK